MQVCHTVGLSVTARKLRADVAPNHKFTQGFVRAGVWWTMDKLNAAASVSADLFTGEVLAAAYSCPHHVGACHNRPAHRCALVHQ
jgi:hypothetical protein